MKLYHASTVRAGFVVKRFEAYDEEWLDLPVE